MYEDELRDRAPGTLVSYGRESYYKPDPLPPADGLSLSDEFYGLLADAAFWGFSTRRIPLD